MREIIFDTETTGLSADDGDRIIELGAVEMIDRRLTGRTLHLLIHPGDRPIHPDAERIHGIGLDRLAGKPRFEAVADEIAAFFDDADLVAHNATFDQKFVDAELARLSRPPLDPARIVDTLMMARRRFPGSPASLDALCRRFDISLARRTFHSALLDCELLAEVYIELTGGRQTGLDLGTDRDAAAVHGRTARTASSGTARQQPRPTPLPSRLTETERAAHDAFVARMGPDALWRRYGVAPPPEGDGTN